MTGMTQTFHRTGAVEAWGRGTNRVIDECKNYGIDPPTFELRGNSVVVTFRAKISVTPQVTPQVTAELSRLRRDLAAERRQDVARGVSPWIASPIDPTAPEGRQERTESSLSPLRGFGVSSRSFQGLTPLATTCRPYGTGEPVEGSANPLATRDRLGPNLVPASDQVGLAVASGRHQVGTILAPCWHHARLVTDQVRSLLLLIKRIARTRILLEG